MDFTTKLKQQMALEMLFQIGVAKQDLKVKKPLFSQLKYKSKPWKTHTAVTINHRENL